MFLSIKDDQVVEFLKFGGHFLEYSSVDKGWYEEEKNWLQCMMGNT